MVVAEADAGPMQRFFLGTLEQPSAKKVRRKDGANLLTADVHGAQAGTTRMARKLRLRQRQLMRTDDIAGARPRTLIPKSCRRENNLSLQSKDIEGAAPRRPYSTARVVNPLCPDYSLPTCPQPEPVPQKQLRETCECRDISGSPLQSSSWHKYPKAGSESGRYIDYGDIAGSSTTWRREQKKRETPGMALETGDIILEGKAKHGFRSGRRTEGGPLTPRYVYDIPAELKESGAEAVAAWVRRSGEVQGNHPSKLPAERRDNPLYSLRTSDIPGNVPGDAWRPSGFPKVRRHHRRTNDVSDIRGTEHSKNLTTFYKQRRKGRGTNPLNPDYRPCTVWMDNAANPLNQTTTPVARKPVQAVAPPQPAPPPPATAPPPKVVRRGSVGTPAAAGAASQAARHLSGSKPEPRGSPLGGDQPERPNSARACCSPSPAAVSSPPPPPRRPRPQSARPGGRPSLSRADEERRSEIESVRALGAGRFV